MAETVVIQSTLFNSESFQQSIGFTVSHLETQWQIATSPDFSTESMHLDTWFITEFLDSFTIPLDDGVYHFRNRYRDNYGVISEWSDPIVVVIDPPPVPDVEDDTVDPIFVSEVCLPGSNAFNAESFSIVAMISDTQCEVEAGSGPGPSNPAAGGPGGLWPSPYWKLPIPGDIAFTPPNNEPAAYYITDFPGTTVINGPQIGPREGPGGFYEFEIWMNVRTGECFADFWRIFVTITTNGGQGDLQTGLYNLGSGSPDCVSTTPGGGGTTGGIEVISATIQLENSGPWRQSKQAFRVANGTIWNTRLTLEAINGSSPEVAASASIHFI